jgi:hypothetical protein
MALMVAVKIHTLRKSRHRINLMTATLSRCFKEARCEVVLGRLGLSRRWLLTMRLENGKRRSDASEQQKYATAWKL